MTQTTNTPTLHDRISNQREAVTNAEQAWRMADLEYEEVAWSLYEAERKKLDALYQLAKVEVKV